MPDKDDKLIWEAMVDPAAAYGSEEKGAAMDLFKLYNDMMASDANIDIYQIRDIMVGQWEKLFNEKGEEFTNMVLNHVMDSGSDKASDIFAHYRTARGNVG